MLLKISLLIILILINGLFSASEMAFLSLNKYELSKELKKGNKKAPKVLNLLNNSSTFLSAIQIAITFSGFLASALAAESFASEIAAYLNITLLSQTALTNILIVLITIVLSYFTLVFGELIPKKIGLFYSKKISFAMVDIINIVITIFKPFIFILKSSVDFFSNLLGIKDKKIMDEDNIKSNIVDANLEEFEKDLLFKVFEFNDKTVKEAMTPKKDIIAITLQTQIDEVVDIIKRHKYTRLPVYDKDEIIGFINMKDFIIKGKSNDINIKDYVRKIPKVKSSMIIDDAFLYLNSNHEAMAKVMEDNKCIGIVTIEDILEEVMGSITDEYN